MKALVLITKSATVVKQQSVHLCSGGCITSRSAAKYTVKTTQSITHLIIMLCSVLISSSGSFMSQI